MKRHAFAFALAALLGFAATAHAASSDTESFETAPLGKITAGQPLRLAHFRIEPADGTSAAIRLLALPSDLASGRVLGAPYGVALASTDIVFDQPRTQVELTLVTPAGDPARQSSITVPGTGNASPFVLGVKHSLLGNRVRLAVGRPDGQPFDRLSLELRDGATVDNLEIPVARRPDDLVLDFDDVREGNIAGRLDAGTAFVMTMADGISVEALAAGGRVLTSRNAAGNDAMILFHDVRNIVELEIEADTDMPATIDVLAENDFEPIASIPVEATSGRYREVFRAPDGRRIQGIRWTGGRVRLHDVVLRDR